MTIGKGFLGALAAGAIAAAAFPASAQDAKDYENTNGQLLVTTCVVCHGQGGASEGFIPAINGLNASEIATAMREFRDEKREQTIMTKIAKGYSDAQIDAIANTLGGM